MPFWGADPEPVQGPDGRMYIFPTNSGPGGGSVRNWHVYSSADLVNWVDHGQIIDVNDVSWARAKAWAPCATYRNGKFYFYYYFFDATPKASVGVCSSPDANGPWIDHTVDAPLTSGLHDPAVFIDDDGQAYIFNSSKYKKLNQDMISTSGDYIRFSYGPSPYRTNEEAAFVFKRNCKYYMTQSPSTKHGSGRPEAVVYYMSDSFADPWTYGGQIMDPVRDLSRHASGYAFHGTYMLWYHTLENDQFHRRRPCADYLTFNADGTIQKIVPSAEGVIHHGQSKSVPNMPQAPYSAKTNSSKQAKQNFLFIAVDDLNTFVGANRELDNNFFKSIYPDQALRKRVAARLTPHIDRLATEGRQFVNAMCQSPLCGPSRTALMTGVPAHASGYYMHNRHFRAYESLKDATTLPQYLKQNGYFTAGLGKIFHSSNVKSLTPAGDWPDTKYSWDVWITAGGGVGLGGAELQPMSPRKSNMRFGASKLPSEETTDWQNSHFTRRLLETGKATRHDNFLKRDVTITLPEDRPFFLASGIFRPHLPFYAPKKYFDMFPTSEMAIDKSLFDQVVADIQDLPEAGRRWTQLTKGKFHEVITRGEKLGGEQGRYEAWKQCIQAYLACVAYADEWCVGEILTGLANSPYRDNTVVMLWSDHGYFLGNKARIAKQCLWRESLNCNLIVSMPGQKQRGVVSEDYVMLTDMFPTILSLAGLERPQKIMGENLSASIIDPDIKLDRKYVYSTYFEGNHSLYNQEWKYIRYNNGDRELYNLHNDPTERINLASRANWQDKVHSMDVELDRQLGLYTRNN